jgi:uncharacterized delta-60 repeat protein
MLKENLQENNKVKLSCFKASSLKIKIIYSFISLMSVCGLGFAQSGSNDATFNPSDVGFASGDGFNNSVTSLCVQSDGKIIAGGTYTAYNGLVKSRMIRLNADFSNDGTFISTGANSTVNAIAQQADGKIIVGGQFSNYNGSTRGRINRVNVDGTSDVAFTPGTGANSTINTIVIQPDGKILIGGAFTSYNGTAINRVARLNANGTIDATFTVGTGAANIVYSLALQPDGKIIVGGAFTTFNGVTINRIVRLNADGTADTGFTPGTGASNNVYSIIVQPDNNIIIAGAFTTYNGTSRARIARLNADGTLESTFNPGTGANNIVYSAGLQADGKIIIAGNFTTVNGGTKTRVARLTNTGSVDASYNPGTGFDATVSACAIQADTMAVLGGAFITYNGITSLRLSRLNQNAGLDVILPMTGANDIISAAALQPDQKTLIGGSFIAYNGVIKNRIARVNTDGSIDATFNSGTGANGTVNTISVQADGKIIMGGAFTTQNGTSRPRIARVSSSGVLDLTFTPGTGANSTIFTTSIQSDGSIIAAGAFTTFNGTARSRVVRLTSGGLVDATFNPGTGANNTIYASAIQPDGKILLGGYFTTFNGVAKNRIVRLNTDGTIDPTFNIGTGVSSYVWKIVLQPDGKILVGGQFSTYNGTTARSLIRLNTDGSLDSSFPTTTNLAVSNSVVDIALQADGKIIIVGEFTSYAGVARNRVARLNANGSLDATVNTSVGANNSIHSGLLQADGNVVIAGKFTSYDGTGRNRLARVIILSGTTITASAAANGTITPAGTTTFTNGSNQTYNISAASGYCIADVLVDGVSVGAVSSYAFSNITTSHTIEATFTNQLVPALDITSGFIGDAICAGSAVTFTATPTNGGPSPTYQWQLNGGNVGTGSTYPNASLTNGDVVTCVLTANNTCQSTATAASNTITISVASVINTTQTVSVCPGQTLTVGSNTYSTTGVYSDTLTAVAGCDSIISTDLTVLNVNTATQNLTICNGTTVDVGSHTYAVSGTYTDTLISLMGCDSILTTNLTVLGVINTNTTMIGVDTISAVNVGATSYQWVDCNGGYAAIPGETNQNFGLTSNGSYAVIVTEGLCSDTSACVTITTIGIKAVASKETAEIRVFPNPNNGMLNVYTSIESTISVSNLIGEVIYTDKINAGQSKIELQNCTNGVYILSAIDKDGNTTHRRFVVEK